MAQEYVVSIPDEHAVQLSNQYSQGEIRDLLASAIEAELSKQERIEEKQEELRAEIFDDRLDERAELERDKTAENEAIAEKQDEIRERILD
jgi:hypothetical protein